MVKIVFLLQIMTNIVLLRNFSNYEAFKCKNLLIVGFKTG